MDAAGTSSLIGSHSTGTARSHEPARLLRAAVVLGMGLLALAGVVLLARKMSAALVSPPSATVLGIVGVMLAAAGLGFRRMLVNGSQSRRLLLAIGLLPSAVAVLWLAALMSAGDQRPGAGAAVRPGTAGRRLELGTTCAAGRADAGEFERRCSALAFNVIHRRSPTGSTRDDATC